MTEELGIERNGDDPLATLALARRDLAQQSGEVLGVLARAAARRGGVVGLLAAEVHVAAGDAPELEPAGPAHLVELEIRPVAGIALISAPYLHRGARVPHERGDVRGSRRHR